MNASSADDPSKSPGKRKLEDGVSPSKKVKTEMSPEEIATLQKELEGLASRNFALTPKIGPTWFKELRSEFKKQYFKDLGEFLETERKCNTIYPPRDEVFSWTIMCSIHDVKVVILGQDPYHGPNQAHGLSFSVKKPIEPPPSLKNMFFELESDIPGFQRPDHGDLTGWAKQGVLLLNAVLTVRKGNPNSHQGKGWENLTDAVINWLNRNKRNLVFMLWGNYAQKKGKCIDQKKHKVLTTSHPSPLSFRNGFCGCKHFSKANDYLREHGKPEINWADLP